MSVIDNIALGFSVAVTPENFLYCLAGAFLGTLLGVFPGLGPVTTIAMLLPCAVAIGGDKRWPSLPDVPSMAESGYPSVRPSAWYGVFAPRGTPPAIVMKLSAVFRKIVSAPELADRLDGIGMVPEPLDSDDFANVIRRDIETNGKVIREAHVTLE
jgi:hypothetical protein